MRKISGVSSTERKLFSMRAMADASENSWLVMVSYQVDGCSLIVNLPIWEGEKKSQCSSREISNEVGGSTK